MSEAVMMRLAWMLPRRIVYWATIRLFAYATAGKYGDTEVPSISLFTALQRWKQSEATG